MQRVNPWSRLWSTAALFLIGGGVGLLMLGTLAVRAGDTPDRPVPVGTPFPGPTTPPLLPDEAAQGTQILAADPLFQKLIAGRQYKIEYVVPWYGADRKRVGVAIEVSLDRPVAGTFEWRDVRYDPETIAGRSYAVSQMVFDAENISRLDVRIDVGKRAVVGLLPGEGSISRLPTPNQAPSGR